MIRLYLVLLAVLVAGIVAVQCLSHDAGYVLVEFGTWVIEGSVPGAVLALIAVFAVLWLLKQAIQLSLGLPRRLRDALAARTAARATQAFETGMLSLFEGHWSRAEAELVRRAADHATPHLNYLAAALAADRLDAQERRDHYLHLALRNDAEVEAAALYTQAELQLARGDVASAQNALNRLRALQPRHPYAVRLQLTASAAQNDWDSVLSLVRESESYASLSAEQRHEWCVRAHAGQIANAVSQLRLERLKAIWESVGAVRDVASLRLGYVRALIRLNAQAEAAAQIAVVLAREWDAELVDCYGELDGVEPIVQLASVEQWLSHHGEHVELLQVAGQACLRAHLWGKAQSYVDAALRLRPSARNWLLQAQLAEQTHNKDAAQLAYRHGLEWAASQAQAAWLGAAPHASTHTPTHPQKE